MQRVILFLSLLFSFRWKGYRKIHPKAIALQKLSVSQGCERFYDPRRWLQWRYDVNPWRKLEYLRNRMLQEFCVASLTYTNYSVIQLLFFPLFCVRTFTWKLYNTNLRSAWTHTLLLCYFSTRSTKNFLLKGLNVRVKYCLCCWETKKGDYNRLYGRILPCFPSLLWDY